MKKRILKLIKNEGGQALLLVIALLGVGGIMLAPLLSFMGTGLETGRVYEMKADELYAADSGVEDAIWKIQSKFTGSIAEVEVQPGIIVTLYGLPPYSEEYTDAEGNPAVYESNHVTYDIADVNGKSVEIYIEDLFGMAYRVKSTATGADGSDTEIEAFVTEVYGDYTGITDFVITSPSDPGYDIDTGVVYPDGEYDPDTNPNGARDNYDGPWPAPIELINYYSIFVDKGNPYYYDGYLEKLDLDDNTTFDYDFITDNGDEIIIGAAYIEGDFDIVNSSNTTKRTLKLDGNLYITGKTMFGGNREWFLDLNGHSIFVESALTSGAGPALLIDAGNNTGVALTGSGCIIAVGDITFQPHMDANPDDYILVLSAIGETRMHPNGAFYGTLAGSVFVDVQSGSDPYIKWNDPDTEPLPDGDGIPDIDFPGGSSSTVIFGLLSWKIG